MSWTCYEPFISYRARLSIHMQPVWRGSGDLIHSLQDHIQKIVFSYPPTIRNQSWNQSTNKKVESALFVILKILNMINPHINTTIVVVITLLNYYWKDFTLHWYKFSTFFNPSVHQNLFFRPFEPSSEVLMHLMEHTQVKCTHLPNNPTCALQLSSNITKVIHLSSYALKMYAHCNTLKWSQFLSDHATHKSQLSHYATLEFYKLGTNAEQIAYFITNHSNFTLKEHSNCSHLPTHVHQSIFFTFFKKTPWKPRLK